MSNPYVAYRSRHQITWAEVARRLGIPHNTARQLGCGRLRSVSARRARDFEARTGGELRFEDLMAWAAPPLSKQRRRKVAARG